MRRERGRERERKRDREELVKKWAMKKDKKKRLDTAKPGKGGEVQPGYN